MASSSTPSLLSGQSLVSSTDAPEENGNYGLRSSPRTFSAGAVARSDVSGHIVGDPNSRSVMAGVEADMGLNESNSNKLQYTSKDITKSAFMVLEELRQSHQLCDVTIRVGSKDFVAHRAVLAATCPYFRGMFTGKQTFR